MTINVPTIRQSITIIPISTSTTCIDYARNINAAIIIVDGIVAVACDNTAIINIAVASIDNTAVIIIVDGVTISVNVACNKNTNAGMVNNDRTTSHQRWIIRGPGEHNTAIYYPQRQRW